MISDEEAAQIDRLRYILAHGCKEGLVASPRDWPGANIIAALLDGKPLTGTWFDRTIEGDWLPQEPFQALAPIGNRLTEPQTDRKNARDLGWTL